VTEICSEEFRDLVFSTREWSQLSELADILSPFSEATDLTQGTDNKTSSRLLNQYKSPISPLLSGGH
jgi:hypothetical protein